MQGLPHGRSQQTWVTPYLDTDPPMVGVFTRSDTQNRRYCFPAANSWRDWKKAACEVTCSFRWIGCRMKDRANVWASLVQTSWEGPAFDALGSEPKSQPVRDREHKLLITTTSVCLTTENCSASCRAHRAWNEIIERKTEETQFQFSPFEIQRQVQIEAFGRCSTGSSRIIGSLLTSDKLTLKWCQHTGKQGRLEMFSFAIKCYFGSERVRPRNLLGFWENASECCFRSEHFCAPHTNVLNMETLRVHSRYGRKGCRPFSSYLPSFVDMGEKLKCKLCKYVK